jgi:hypothetical protein
MEVVKMRSAGSWLPFGAVVRFCILPEEPVEVDSSQGYVPEKSMGKLEFMPDAIEVVLVTVMER